VTTADGIEVRDTRKVDLETRAGGQPFRFQLDRLPSTFYNYSRAFTRVYIVKLGCSVLKEGVFKGGAFGSAFHTQIVMCASQRGNESQIPHLSRDVTDGAPEIQDQMLGHPSTRKIKTIAMGGPPAKTSAPSENREGASTRKIKTIAKRARHAEFAEHCGR
jgi:hypothetical protein